jgi:TonB family protein
MTQLQKKSFVASSGVHGLLLAVLLLAAFLHSEVGISEEQVLTIISPRILDTTGSGGEAPAVVAPLTAAPPSTPAPTEPAPRLRPTPPEKAATRMAPSTRIASATPEKPSATARSSSKPHEIVPDLTHTTRGTSPTAKPFDSAATTSRASTATRSEEVAQTMAELGSKIRNSTAEATVVTLPGEGGGEAFVGYRTAIYNAYFHAWKAPDDVAGSHASADVQILVARDGSIISAEIIKPSGDAAVDRSVRRALDAVKQLPPFPPAAQDAQRSFIITFDLSAKQSSG